MDRIKVVITPWELETTRVPACAPAIVLERLRNAGIPVKGHLVLLGVTRGTLIEMHEMPSGNLIYEWSDDERS